MKRSLLRAGLLLGALAVPSVAAAQYSLVASESFEYPVGNGIGGEGGGLGWSNTWWSGATADDAVVSAGSCDTIGERATTNLSNAGSYRTVDTGPHADVVDPGAGGSGQDVFGLDGSTLWISFCCGRVAGGDDQYGGFSLFNQGCCEALFLGSPYQSFEWGLQFDPGAGGPSYTVAGSSVDVFSKLVYRIDFMPGDERVRMWIDPASDHPSTAADIDVTVGDLRFNEVRIQSGEPVTTVTGYDFDALLIEKESASPFASLCFGDGSGAPCPCGNEDAGGTGGCANTTGSGATLAASGSNSVGADDLVLTATNVLFAQPGLFFVGDDQLNGGDGILFGDGLRCCGNNVIRIQTVTPDMSGTAATSVGIASLTGATAGNTVCFQHWYRDPIGGGVCGAGFNLTNAVATTWAP